LASLLLTACNPLPDNAQTARNQQHQQAMDEAEGKIECRLPGGDAFARVCAIDRVSTQDGLFLTLRHPDGGFRRLLVTKDGRGVIAADGAEQAVVTPTGPNQIEVALGGARYRLPATVRGSTPAAK
jgi:hypothetical protein